MTEFVWVWYLLLIVFALNMLDQLIRTAAIYFHKTPKVIGPKAVSIVIAARNEGDKLDTLIRSLFQQDHPDFEVIIILDRCSDQSLDLMKTLEKEFSKLKTVIVDYLPEHFSPKKFALTLGIKAASNECILLTDADCLPLSNGWITKMTSHFDDQTDFIIGYSPYLSEKGWLNRYIRFETFVTGFRYLSSSALGFPYMAVGRNLVLRKSKFLKINGYNRFQHIHGGDDDLLIHYHANNKNTKITFNADAQTTSKAKDNWSDFIYQKTRHYHIGKYYSLRSKLIHSINWGIQIALYVSFAILAILDTSYYPNYILISGYLLMKGLTYWMIGRKMSRGFASLWFPLLEFYHLWILPALVIRAQFTKKVKWK